MPIRLNLLAEMQAIEDLRRRDPVKRTIIAGFGLAAVMLVWITSLMVERIGSNGEIATLEQRIQSGSKDYKEVLDNQQNLVTTRQKLVSLHQLSTNRFLMGNLLDALQKSSVDNVQLTHFKIDQSYVLLEGTKAGTNAETGAPVPGKPSTATERITITLTAKDTGLVPGDSIGHFQSALSHNPSLHPLLTNRTNEFRLTTSLTPQTDAEGHVYVSFILEAHLPDKTR